MQIEKDSARAVDARTASPDLAPPEAVTVPIGLARRLVSEGLGTALLLATVVGSGIMGERLAAGNGAVALLANSLATGAALVALILTFGPISGAHFNPVVTAAMAWRKQFPGGTWAPTPWPSSWARWRECGSPMRSSSSPSS